MEGVAVAWWVAEKGAPWEFLGPTEINQEAAKRTALARSDEKPGTVFQVRYHMNANAPAEVRWEAVNGGLARVAGDAEKSAEPSGAERGQSSNSGQAAPVVPKTETGSIWQSVRRWFT